MRKLEQCSIFIETTKNMRNIRILLPNDYYSNKQQYPVLYMHDGQNLFHNKSAYSGHCWEIAETLKKLQINDIIVVGIDNSGRRLDEYSPWKSSKLAGQIIENPSGGLGDTYAEFIVNDLKSFIDRNYRTLSDYENTMIAGSSMGAYISTYIAVKYPNVFSVVGLFSLSSWFNEKSYLQFINNSIIVTEQKYFISVGCYKVDRNKDSYSNNLYLQNSRNLYKLLKEKHVKNILYIETDDTHNELAWRKMFVNFIEFLKKKSQ